MPDVCAAAFAMHLTGCSHPAENNGHDAEIDEVDLPAHTASALALSTAFTASRSDDVDGRGGCARFVLSHRASSLAAIPLND